MRARAAGSAGNGRFLPGPVPPAAPLVNIDGHDFRTTLDADEEVRKADTTASAALDLRRLLASGR
jgi:hypothetical protein